MRLRDLIKNYENNTKNYLRSLYESTISPELVKVLKDWTSENKDGIIIGGIALSFHTKPRYTEDLDILYLSPEDAPKVVKGFKKISPHAFQHNQTHAVVEVIDPEHIKVPYHIVVVVFTQSIMNKGVRVADASGLVALKLHRLHTQDKADIIALIKTGRVDLSGYGLTKKQLREYFKLVKQAKKEVKK